MAHGKKELMAIHAKKRVNLDCTRPNSWMWPSGPSIQSH